MSPALANERTVDSSGVKIAVRDFGGDGPDMLLIHGAGSTLGAFAELAPHLTPTHHVVAMDVRNHGRSGDGPYTWPAVVDDVTAVVEALDLTDPVIVGHSLGGMIGALYGGTSSPCRAVVNLDGHSTGVGLPPDHPDEVEARARLNEMTKDAIASQLGPIPAAVIDAQLAALPEEKRAAARENGLRGLVEQEDGSYAHRLTNEARAELMAQLETLDLFDTYRRCRTPLLIFNATAETSPPPVGPAEKMAELADFLNARRKLLGEALRRLADEQAHIEVAEIEATHWLINEKPAEIAERIAAFLDNPPGTPA